MFNRRLHTNTRAEFAPGRSRTCTPARAPAMTLVVLALVAFVTRACAQEMAYSWHSPHRAARVADLIPGRRIPIPAAQSGWRSIVRQRGAMKH